MQQVSQAVIDILISDGHEALAYIDDIAGYHSTQQGAQGAFNRCAGVLKELGLVEALEKQHPPGNDMIWLGVRFNTVAMKMSIPHKKITEIHEIVRQWLQKTTCSQSQLNSLLGKLFFRGELLLYVTAILQPLAHHSASIQ